MGEDPQMVLADNGIDRSEHAVVTADECETLREEAAGE